jgi:hypothetical protein
METMNDLVKKVEELEARARQRSQERGEGKPDNVIQLPLWSDPRRAAPSAAFRSALFPALGRQKRRWFKDEAIYSVKGVSVTFRGEQFDQSDLDVFLEIIHQMRDHPNEAEFTAHGLLKPSVRSFLKIPNLFSSLKSAQWSFL